MSKKRTPRPRSLLSPVQCRVADVLHGRYGADALPGGWERKVCELLEAGVSPEMMEVAFGLVLRDSIDGALINHVKMDLLDPDGAETLLNWHPGLPEGDVFWDETRRDGCPLCERLASLPSATGYRLSMIDTLPDEIPADWNSQLPAHEVFDRWSSICLDPPVKFVVEGWESTGIAVEILYNPMVSVRAVDLWRWCQRHGPRDAAIYEFDALDLTPAFWVVILDLIGRWSGHSSWPPPQLETTVWYPELVEFEHFEFEHMFHNYIVQLLD